MCSCKQEKQKVSQQRRRRKLWDLKDYLCSIIGTCLSIDDLKKLGRKTELEVDPSLSTYDLHVLFVQEVSEANHDSRLVNKKLNNKFQLSIKQAGRVQSPDELLDFWHYSKEQNRLAGAYWAILTHPLASTSLCHKIHGEIHMLSHLATRKNSHAVHELRDKNNKIEVLQEALQLAGSQATQHQAWRDEEISELKVELQDRGKVKTILQQTLSRLAAFETGEKYNKLQADNKQLQAALSKKSATCVTLTAENQQLHNDQQRLSTQLVKLQCKYSETTKENKAMDHLLYKQTDSCPTCDTCACKDCPGLDLCGRCVLYVGGQHSLVPHYRQVVEDCGGKFIHHDGGKEDQRIKLGKMMSKADVVICPVNFVSHDACLRAKKICKSQAKLFIAMRSAGLSALARGLEQVVESQPIQNTLETQ